MVLAPGFTGKTAEERLEALRNSLVAKDYMDEDGKISYKCSMSYGVVEVAVNNTSQAGDLLSLADEKMYAYKRAYKAERRDAPA
jgi:GGDEF domain-containing protein